MDQGSRMKTYNVAGIILSFHYEHAQYFDNNIEHYEVDYEAEHHICVYTVNHIERPASAPHYSYKNRHFHQEGDKHVFVVKTKNNDLKIRMEHTPDYKQQTIFLNRQHIKNIAEMEYVTSGLMFMQLALYKNVLPLHASAITHNNEAILFTGSSGTGKSTHAHHWLNTFENTQIINDDKPLLHEQDGRIVVSGSPWSGKNAHNQNVTVPLKAVVFLEQGKNNIVSVPPKKLALQRLFKDCMRPIDKTLMHNTLLLIETILDNTPYYHYTLTKSSESVQPIYDAVFNKKSKH